MIPPDIAATMREATRRDRSRLQELIDKGLMPLTPHWQGELDRMAQALAYLDTLPAAPAPDWSKAPDWAQWWAVDANGGAWWYSIKPHQEKHNNTWIYVARCELDNSICPNWRTTLVARPTEEK